MENATTVPSAKRLAIWQHHWRDESDAAFLYRILAEGETEAEQKIS